MISQELPTRYIDKEKLVKFWRTHPDFRGKSCAIVDVRILTNLESLALSGLTRLSGDPQMKQDCYVVEVPREMTQVLQSGQDGCLWVFSLIRVSEGDHFCLL